MVLTDQNLTTYAKRLLLVQVGAAVLICLVAGFVRLDLLYSWLIGCVATLVDNVLFLRAVRKGMKKNPEEAVQLMQQTMLKRIAFLAFLSVVMLRLNLSVIGVFIGFILLHIILIFNLIIIAYRKGLQERFVKKGVD